MDTNCACVNCVTSFIWNWLHSIQRDGLCKNGLMNDLESSYFFLEYDQMFSHHSTLKINKCQRSKTVSVFSSVQCGHVVTVRLHKGSPDHTRNVKHVLLQTN